MVRKFKVKAKRKNTWVTVGKVYVNDNGTGAFFPYWLPDTTYRLFEEDKAKPGTKKVP